MGGQVGVDFFPPGVQHGADECQFGIGGFRPPAERPHPTQTGQPAPAQQPHQNGFGLVIGMMGHEDKRSAGFDGRRSEEPIADPPGGGFQGSAGRPLLGRDIGIQAAIGDAPAAGLLGYKVRVGRGIRPEPVIDMGDQKTGERAAARVHQPVQERQRIRAAGNRHQQSGRGCQLGVSAPEGGQFD